tara:strand:- start:645 stop:1181 length:537 start_codon:yes stop_codon:yes gene_type:complete
MDDEPDKAQRLNLLLQDLGSLNNRGTNILEGVKSLKQEQIALHSSIEKILNIVNRLTGTQSQIQSLLNSAGEEKEDQDKLIDEIMNVIDIAPNRDEVDKTVTQLQEAIQMSGQNITIDKPKDIDVDINNPILGGFKYRRDNSARVELKTRTLKGKRPTKTKSKKSTRRRIKRKTKRNK